MRRAKISAGELESLAALIGRDGENDWHTLDGRKAGALFKKGLLEVRTTETIVGEASPRGGLRTLERSLTKEYRVARAYVAEARRARGLPVQDAAEVPRDVAAMGHIAVTFWRVNGRKPTTREVDEIMRDLGGGY